MAEIDNFTGCQVILYDLENNKAIGETTILRHDKSESIIVVEEAALKDCGLERVTLLILHHNSLFEFQGNVRKTSTWGEREIALFQGRAKEDRTARRYPVNLPARVENLVVGKRLLALRSPLKVLVLNISTEGVLLKAKISSFNIGTTFQLIMDMGGKETLVNTTVVRIGTINDTDAEFGCKFNYLYS